MDVGADMVVSMVGGGGVKVFLGLEEVVGWREEIQQ